MFRQGGCTKKSTAGQFFACMNLNAIGILPLLLVNCPYLNYGLLPKYLHVVLWTTDTNALAVRMILKSALIFMLLSLLAKTAFLRVRNHKKTSLLLCSIPESQGQSSIIS